MTHTPISPSSFERRLLCAGSYHAEKDLSNITSKYAEEGIYLHEVISTEKLGIIDFDKYSLNDEQKEAIKESLNYVYKTGLDNPFAGQKIIYNLNEYKVDLSFLGIEMSGTCDKVIYFENELHVFDYKFGKGVWVNIVNNYQLALYTLGCIKALKLDVNNLKIFVHILQPFLKNFQRLELSISDKILNKNFYKEVINKCLDIDAIRTPSEKACKFCKAKLNCPAVTNLIPKTFEKELGDAKLKTILDNKEIILNYIKTLEEEVKTRIESGVKFEGYTIRRKNTNRSWKNDAYDYLTDRLGDDAFEKKIIGIPKAEKILGKDIINDLTEKKEGEYELVRELDKSEEILKLL